jgi:class 3 adenylate cyclase
MNMNGVSFRPSNGIGPTINPIEFSAANPAKILIVDDEPGSRQLMRTVLLSEGHSLFEARDGAEAIEMFHQVRPDLVLLDVMLPKVDGLDVLRAIREHDPMIGVVMVSALSSEQLAVRSMLGGADDYLSKPLTLKTMRMHVRQVLDKVQLRRHNATLQEQLIDANEKLRHYMAAPLLETLLASPTLPSLGGQRHQVTILFLDFCDFTAVTLQYPPDEVVQILNEYFALLTSAVIEQDGYLDKIMGDGFMALFNVPQQRSDHATFALRSALIMRQRVHQWNRSRSGNQPLMNIRVGIHTGEAVVGNIGTSNLMNFTAIGREVNLAKRLEEDARPGQILLSDTTRSVLNLAALDLAPKLIVSGGMRRLRGFALPLEVFSVVDEEAEIASPLIPTVRSAA